MKVYSFTPFFYSVFGPQRCMPESSLLKRSEAGPSVPAVSISVPRPSMGFGLGLAAGNTEKTASFGHMTGLCSHPRLRLGTVPPTVQVTSRCLNAGFRSRRSELPVAGEAVLLRQDHRVRKCHTCEGFLSR